MIYGTGSTTRTAARPGEAHYAVLIQPGKTVYASDGRRLRPIDVVAVDETDSPYVWPTVEAVLHALDRRFDRPSGAG